MKADLARRLATIESLLVRIEHLASPVAVLAPPCPECAYRERREVEETRARQVKVLETFRGEIEAATQAAVARECSRWHLPWQR